jgi:phenylalanyl-tRNA synthetase beta subunit
LDLAGEHDMTEEIGRIYGYEKITPKVPKLNFSAKQNDSYLRTQAARTKLLGDGYSEVMTYTFTKKGNVEVARGPKGKEFLRTNLSDGLKVAHEMNRLNAPLLGVSVIKLFEIGAVFPQKDVEEVHVAYVDGHGVVESTLEEFTQDSASVPALTESARGGQFMPWSMYPCIVRDVAVWLPESQTADTLIALCTETMGSLLARAPYVFDTFSKDGKTSVAVRMVLGSHTHTLTDDEISPSVSNLADILQNQGFILR